MSYKSPQNLVLKKEIKNLVLTCTTETSIMFSNFKILCYPTVVMHMSYADHSTFFCLAGGKVCNIKVKKFSFWHASNKSACKSLSELTSTLRDHPKFLNLPWKM